MLRDPKFRLTDPKFYGEFESELRSGFRARNGELKASGVSGSEGDNSPVRARNSERSSDSNSPDNLGSVGQNLGFRGMYTQR